MGYIFDALNKQRGDQQAGPAPDPAPHSDAAAGGVTGPDLISITDTDEHAQVTGDPAAPLRMAGLTLDQAGDHPAQPSAIAAAMGAGDAAGGQGLPPAADPDKTIEAAPAREQAAAPGDAAPLQIQTASAAPAKSWWGRLLGRHLRGGKLDDRLVTMTMPASSVSEEYRSIRTSILARHDNARHLVHTITSATPQEGKTITCVNLGLSFAELRNRSTVIVECDLRLPTFAKLLSCDTARPGLIDYLRGDAALGDVIQKVEGSSLQIIPAGGRVSDEAVQLLSGSRMSQLIQSLRAKYDHVIIDTPPVLTLADAGILGSQSEEVLLVARMRRTPRTLVEQAVNTLTSYNAVVSGIVATDNPRSRRGYGYKYGYGYRYAYGYGYGYTDDSRKKRRRHRAA